MDSLTPPASLFGSVLQVLFFTVVLPVAIVLGLTWAAVESLREAVALFLSETRYIFRRSAGIYGTAWTAFFNTMRRHGR